VSLAHARLAGLIAEAQALDRTLDSTLRSLTALNAASDSTRLADHAQRARRAADALTEVLDRLFAAASEADADWWDTAHRGRARSTDA